MLLGDVRQEILQDILASSGRMTTPMVERTPYLVPYAFSDGATDTLYLVNGSLDAAENVPLRMPEENGAYEVRVLPSRGEPSIFTVAVVNGKCVLPLAIDSLESALVTFQRLD